MTQWSRWAIRSLFAILPMLWVWSAAAGALLVAAPAGDPRFDQQQVFLESLSRQSIALEPDMAVASDLLTVRAALARAGPGDTILLVDGTYNQGVPENRLDIRVGGRPDSPITIRGTARPTSLRTGARITFMDGDQRANPYGGPENAGLIPPFERSTNCVIIDGRAYIVLENLYFDRCYHAAIRARDSQYITVRNAVFLGGSFAILAEGRRSHHYLVEYSDWAQDPSGSMWSRDHWCEYKFGKKRHYNGAFFGSRDIAGSVVIRHNIVRHAFNAIRMDVTYGNDSPLAGLLNVNVEIYGNHFSFIRDNVVEPEGDATNWWIHGNTIFNAHAWFSFDGTMGGHYYVFENRAWFDEKPSQECDARCQTWEQRNPSSCRLLHDEGKVFKLRQTERYLPGPVYIFNNSWYLRSTVSKNGNVGILGHWNNAVGFCLRNRHPNGSCDRPPFLDGLAVNKRHEFRNDLSNHRDFPDEARRRGYDVDGFGVDERKDVFIAGSTGDLRLSPGSPGLGAACTVEIAEDGSARCVPDSADGNVGAVQPESYERSIFFRHMTTPSYKEQPRIVDVSWRTIEKPSARTDIRVTFSLPVVLPDATARLSIVLDDDESFVSRPCTADGRIVSCELGEVLGAKMPERLFLPAGITSADTGLPMTLWARSHVFVDVQR